MNVSSFMILLMLLKYRSFNNFLNKSIEDKYERTTLSLVFHPRYDIIILVFCAK